jgi:(S)-ureidoglycine aminohydrolase
MPELFGHTRAHVGARHALITPENHVTSLVPGITGATAVILINGAMGAGLAQSLVTFQAGGGMALPLGDNETFGFFLSGGATVAIGGKKHRCREEGYFFVPPRLPWTLGGAKAGTRLVLIQKRYVSLGGAAPPRPFVGDARRVRGGSYLGDPAVRLQTLLPEGPAFDFAVNILTYQPGAHLPIVEVHVMEHGLVMLSGQGVYRLEDSWYPVREGDSLWMAPYCAQWFVAMGSGPASYLYCKDVNRAPL